MSVDPNPAREVPRKMVLDRAAQTLRIEWLDGHASEYGSGYLRFTCPCAACRGHAPGEVEPPRWADCEAVTVSGASKVGGYALQFAFSDGHQSGIFAFDHLRDVCPCPRCSAP